MITKIAKLGGKAAWWVAKRQAKQYSTEASIALGLIGAAITAREVLQARRRSSAVRGKVVVIMGGSRGLGLELARQFGRNGAHLVLVSRNDEELRNALGYLEREQAIPNGSAAHTVTADVTNLEDCKRVMASADQRYGRVDILINCAAIMAVAPVMDMPIEAFDKAMQVNFFGALNAIHAVLPQMLGRSSGAIVNIASIGGKMAVPHMLPYTASKFALVGLSEGLHAELRHTGVRVTTVCPGLMRTGSHSAVDFAGDARAEHRWFRIAATAPLISTSARSAARQIYNAVCDGRAEITITPQAYLAARMAGLMPETVQMANAAVNQLILPAPNGKKTFTKGKDLEGPKVDEARSTSLHLIGRDSTAA